MSAGGEETGFACFTKRLHFSSCPVSSFTGDSVWLAATWRSLLEIERKHKQTADERWDKKADPEPNSPHVGRIHAAALGIAVDPDRTQYRQRDRDDPGDRNMKTDHGQAFVRPVYRDWVSTCGTGAGLQAAGML